MSQEEPTNVADIRYNCPICFTALFPPVFQCLNGHLLCETCITRLKHCGICRVSLSRNKRVRNLEIEKIIRIIKHPCPNEDDGCDAKLKFDRVEHHRLECNYTKFPICKEIMGEDCEETRITDYAEHSERVHGRKFVDIRRKALPVTFTARMYLIERGSFGLTFRFPFEEKATLVVVVGRHNSETDLVTWKPYVLAGRAATNQLCCKISLSSDVKVKIQSESPIFNLQSTPGDLETCLSASLKYLHRIFGAPSVNDEDAGKCWISIELSKKAGNHNEPTNAEEALVSRGS